MRTGAGGGDYSGATDANGPCADYRPGEDDLQAFDFIRQFRLDVLETKYPGVKRVQGSSRLQTAYKLENEADLVLPTRYVAHVMHKLNLNDKFIFCASKPTGIFSHKDYHNSFPSYAPSVRKNRLRQHGTLFESATFDKDLSFKSLSIHARRALSSQSLTFRANCKRLFLPKPK